ncbi:MAG TPA: alpha/beta hydrolase [Verrucomicrobiae bacterium]
MFRLEDHVMTVNYQTVRVNGLNIFYRAAGDRNLPVVLLLHGFPTSSHMFRNLIPILAEHYHVVAPDFPGFGQTDLPNHQQFSYTFSNLADVIGKFTESIGLKQFSIYIFDYGAPVGLRMALKHPERISAIISQNGNAYVEGLSDGWNPIRAYWKDPSQKNRDALRAMLTPQTTEFQYVHGVADKALVSPDGRSLDDFYLTRPGAHEAQLDLFLDYAKNVEMYPEFQNFFRKQKPPLLAVWGKNDPFFLPAGAEAYKRDIPNAEIQFLDTGHFALETHCSEIGGAILKFLKKNLR